MSWSIWTRQDKTVVAALAKTLVADMKKVARITQP